MMVNINKLFEEDFDVSMKKSITENILTAIKAYNIFVHDQKDFFTYDNFGSLRGEFLTYCVNKTMSEEAFTPKSKYRALDEDVNDYGRGIVHLFTENFVTTVSRTGRMNKLPRVSKYKRQYAQANDGCDGQMKLGFIKDKVVESVLAPKYYAIATYGYSFELKDCTHIQLLVPDARYKKIIASKDLLKEHKDRALLVDVSQQQEGQIVKLNQEMEKLVKLKLEKKE